MTAVDIILIHSKLKNWIKVYKLSSPSNNIWFITIDIYKHYTDYSNKFIDFQPSHYPIEYKVTCTWNLVPLFTR